MKNLNKIQIIELLDKISIEHNLSEVDKINIDIRSREEWGNYIDDEDTFDFVDDCYTDDKKIKALVLLTFLDNPDYAIINEEMNIDDAEIEIVNWLESDLRLI